MKLNAIKCLLFFLSFTVAAKETAFKKIQWIDLMPEEDVEALYNPPDALFDMTEDEEADMSEEVFNALMKAADKDYQRALSSTRVIKSLDNQNIKISGFIVPLALDGDKATEFFIVPYFGACMHYPPPPPNQTIFAEYKEGVLLEKIYEPFTFSGLLTIFKNKNDIAESAYYLSIESVNIYTE